MKFVKYSPFLTSSAILLALVVTGGAPVSAQDSGNSACMEPWVAFDGDDDGIVSKEEASIGSGGVFDAIDQDGDGEIARDEYDACQRSYLQAPVAPVKNQAAAVESRQLEAYKAADLDGDGVISRYEYMRSTANAHDQASRDWKDANARDGLRAHYVPYADDGDEITGGEAGDRAATTFASYDKNNDGAIDESEWVDTSQSDYRAEVSDRRFSVLDLNKDGKLSRDEYSQHYGNAYENALAGWWDGDSSDVDEATTTETEPTETNRVSFASLDENNDGGIDSQEWERASADGIIETDAQFDVIDLNKDGKLDRRELTMARNSVASLVADAEDGIPATIFPFYSE